MAVGSRAGDSLRLPARPSDVPCLSVSLPPPHPPPQTTDDIVSSAECSSDDEDLEECDSGHAGGMGVCLSCGLPLQPGLFLPIYL